MLGVFAALKDNVPIGRKLKDPSSEGVANRLHFRVSVIMLMGCSLLVTCLEWVGNGHKISCVMEGAVDSWTIAQNVISLIKCNYSIIIDFSCLGHQHLLLCLDHLHPPQALELQDRVRVRPYRGWLLQSCGGRGYIQSLLPMGAICAVPPGTMHNGACLGHL